METNKTKLERRERFVRIVEKRVNNIFQYLDSLGNCSNKRNYEYTEDDVKKIFNEIDKKVKETKGKFENKSSRKSNFRLNA